MTKKTYRRALLGIIRHLWIRHGWLIIGLLWAIALLMGFVGFAVSDSTALSVSSVFDYAYRTLQLIPMNSGDVDNAGWQLNVARFLIPILTALTFIRTLFFFFRDRWQRALLHLWYDHIIICGLSRKGWLLAQGFVERGDNVVVIEVDDAHDLVNPGREAGMVVLIGDATDPAILHQAGLSRARHLIAVTEDDGVNVEIAVRVQELLRAKTPSAPHHTRQHAPLICTVHLVDPLLSELARTRELALEAGIPFRLELFNVFEQGARQLWSQFGPPNESDGKQMTGEQETGRSTHLLVVGLGRLGESLVTWAARDWHARKNDHPCRATGRLHITVVDQAADWKCQALCLRYPQLIDVCDLIPLKINVRWPEFHEGALLVGNEAIPPVSSVFICFDNDSLGLRTGLLIQQRLLNRMPSASVPVVVRMAETRGLARLVDLGGSEAASFINLHAFGLLDNTCTPEAILGGTHEVLARGLHEAYLQQQRSLGHTSEINPSLVPWDELPEVFRESNRAEVGAVFHHLASIGYRLIPLIDWDAAFFRFSESEIDGLAEKEHARFIKERLNLGWRHTKDQKDISSRQSPALVTWAELSEEERIKTCEIMSELPATLARAGFQVVRVGSTGQPASRQ